MSELKPDEISFVEEVGVFFEQSGIPSMAGRILGCLLICEPEHLSLIDLAGQLQASKGSISTASRMLRQAEIVEKIKFPKDRNDYYRIKEDAWTCQFKNQTKMVGDLQELAARGLRILARENKARSQRLLEMKEFYDWLSDELPELFERWENTKKVAVKSKGKTKH